MSIILLFRNVILLLSLLCYQIINSSSKFTPRLEYISYISNTLGSYTINYNGATTTKVFSSLMTSDDGPFEEFILPFSFPFLGSDIYRIFINPNGAIHTDLDQPCPMCNCFGDLKDCSLNSSYYLYPKTNTYVDVGYANVIAGILYDLLPANSTTYGNISAIYSNTAVTIKFDRIKAFGQPGYYGVEYSFDITLVNDGSIIINYGSITKYPDAGTWVSGIRGPRSSSYTSDIFILKYANLTASQIALKSTWKTKFYGIYPNTATVGGKYFVVCPLSMTWTATTVNVDSSNYDSIKFKPLSISCSSMFASGSLKIGIYNQTTPSVVDECNYDSTNKWFSCKLSTILGGTPPVSGDYSVYFKWKENVHSTSWTDMNAKPITFKFGVTLDPNVCAINDYTTSSCDACTIYSSNNFTCFKLPCTNTQLYGHTDCNGNCWTTSTADNSYYLADIYNQCCALADIDCAGQCYGSQSTGYEKLPTTPSLIISKCCNADCIGLCGGSTQRDACGICGGTDNKGKTCATFVSVNTGHTSNDIYANISALVADKPLVTYVNVSNTNDTLIRVTLQLTGSSFLGPDISINKTRTTILGNSSKLFSVNTSLNSMINGDINGWEVKKINIQYDRPSYSDFKYSYTINVYPTTENCSAVTNRNTCMRLPGCIFCYSYPAVRVLKQNDNDISETTSLWRRLFTNIMAEQAGVRTYSLSVGSCIDGWSTDQCQSVTNGSDKYHIVNYNIVIFTSFLMLFLFV